MPFACSTKKTQKNKNAEDCNKANILVGFNENYPGSGFGSKVVNFFNMLAYAEHKNKSVALWGQSKFLKTMASFFETSFLPTCDGIYNFELEKYARQYENSLSKNENVVSSKRALYAKYYKYNEETSKHIDQTLEAIGLPTKFFGIHIRTGDKAKEGAGAVVNADSYGKAIKKEGMALEKITQSSEEGSQLASVQAQEAADHILSRKEEGVRTVYVATIADIEQVKRTLREKLGSEYEIKHLTQSVSNWEASAESQYGPGSQAMYDVLTDVEALRRSHIFFGTGSSNMGKLTYWLRPSDSKSVSLHGKWTLEGR